MKDYVKKNILIKIFFLICVCSTLFVSTKYNNIYSDEQSALIEQKLKTIPYHDRKLIRYFFKKLILKDICAYTLFGNKPMSFTSYEKSPYLNYLYVISKHPKLLLQQNRYFHRGYMAWEKHSHLFPSNNFIIRCYPGINIKGICEITIINKKAFLNTINENIQIFEKFLGKNFTPENVLREFEIGKGKYFDIIRTNEWLTGILLGYGTENSMNFYKRSIKSPHYFKDYLPHELIINEKNTHKQDTSFLTFNENEDLNSKLQSFSNELPPFTPFIILPNFAANPNTQETKQLKLQYVNERAQMFKKFQKNYFLTAVLLQFIK